MLLKILKLFGINLPAAMAEVRVDVEERFQLARDRLEQATQTAAALALLFVLAALAALAAFVVGLIALYRWVSNSYGEFYGFAAIGGILLFIAVLMFVRAIGKSRSWPGESASRVAAKKLELAQARAERVASATKAFEGPALSPPPQSSSAASDFVDPLVWALSSTINLPTMENPAIDALFAHLQSCAREFADETVDGLLRAVRDGDRPQMLAALGSAVFVGWFLGRHSQRQNRRP